jgi:hypothetical protein
MKKVIAGLVLTLMALLSIAFAAMFVPAGKYNGLKNLDR